MNLEISRKIKFNEDIKLIISDVDETIADVYQEADPELVGQLDHLLTEGKVLFLVSGHSADGIVKRIIDKGIGLQNRPRILIAHCSGTEVFGFDASGKLMQQPFYSVYEEKLSAEQKNKFRAIVDQVIKEFQLITYPTGPIKEFKQKTNSNPLAIMIDDRRCQITLEFKNAVDISDEVTRQIPYGFEKGEHGWDLREPVIEKFHELFLSSDIPISARKAGVFAVDLVVEGVSKTTAVKFILESDHLLSDMGLDKEELADPKTIEVWGDKFSEKRGGTDRHISEALPKEVRSVDFRLEDPDEFPKGYNIQVWDGEQHLHEGLLEYLKTRNLQN